MKKINSMTNIAMIAALYFVLSMAFQFMAFGPVQIRLAEALIVTAILSRQGIYGTTIGCLITNIVGVAMGMSTLGIYDIVFGTLFTLFASVLAYFFRDYVYTKWHLPLISLMMPVLVNALGLPIIIAIATATPIIPAVYFSMFFSIFIGQFISCVILGGVVYMKSGAILKERLNS